MNGVSDAPVVVIGLDAMEMSIARQMIDERTMPNLGRFLDGAAWSLLQHSPGLVVGSVWPTLSAGCGPDHHGFYCDLEIEPGTYESWHWGPERIEVPRVWDVLSAAGKRCAILDVPLTRPSDDLNGVQICEWGAHDRFVPLSSAPDSFADEVVAEFGEYPVQPKCDSYVWADDLDGLYDALCEGIVLKERLASAWLARGPWDLFWTVFGESHCAGHQFYERRPESMIDVYRRIDVSLGRVLEQVPAAATVIVMLSHGMGNHHDGTHLVNEILRRLEVANGGESRWIGVRERALRQVQRRRRDARGGKPLFGERRVFRVHNNDLYGGVRVNLKGREPRGRVTPGAEYDAALDSLRRDLLELENPETGQPLVLDVWRTDDLYDGPKRDRLPDAFIVWNRRAPIRGARSEKIGTVEGVSRATRSGDHRPTGILAVQGAGVPAGQFAKSVPSVDVAPTIAALLEVEMSGVEGRPIEALLTATPT